MCGIISERISIIRNILHVNEKEKRKLSRTISDEKLRISIPIHYRILHSETLILN